MWGLIIAELAIVIAISAAINRLSLTTATLLFVLYSVLNGATFSLIFAVYTMSSIANVFFITAGTFEEKVNEMLKKKRELADLAVGVGESWIGDLTDDEIKSIFSLSSSGI